MDISGNKALPNTGVGGRISGDNLAVGGSTADDRNIISGNTGDGMWLEEANNPGKSMVMSGNYIGIGADGHTVVPNGGNGAVIAFYGATSGDQIINNLIGGNGGNGMTFGDSGGTCSDMTIKGNFIGVTPGGSAVGNGSNGIMIPCSTSTIGGTNPSDGNTIAYNQRAGIVVTGRATDVRILRNSMYNNGTIAIDLSNDGITLNDLKDPDTGPNNLQNYPVISYSMTACDGATKTAPGTFNSTPNTVFTIDYYANPSWSPTSGLLREGEQWVSNETITTDANGDATFHLPGSIVNPSATATDPNGNTSEFGSVSDMKFTNCQNML